MSLEAAKALSNWSVQMGDVIVGGISPEIPTSHSDLFQEFKRHIFVHDLSSPHGRGWMEEARNLLVSTLLLRYDDVCQVILEEPTGAFVDLSEHKFVSRVTKSELMLQFLMRCLAIGKRRSGRCL
jgi:hypothetical protein